MKKMLLPVAMLLMTGCAMTYAPPTTNPTLFSSELKGTKTDLMKVARLVLISEGYQIASSDADSGTISTAPRNLRVTPDTADCGTTMGIDYLKDNRTSTRVSYGLIIDDGKLTVKANVEGEYKPGAVTQDMTLTCISRGLLEKNLFEKIRVAAKTQ